MRNILILLIVALTFVQNVYPQKRLSITIDDPNTYSTPLLTSEERNFYILQSLDKHSIQAALFVCGKRVADENGAALLRTWDNKNHLICNHSYSHWYLNSSKITLEEFQKDILKADSIVSSYMNYSKLFRFPYLKEGNTKEKIQGMRDFLNDIHYRNGYVTIDASDWFIDSELIKEITRNPDANLEGYKQYYLHHIIDRIQYYDSLSMIIFKRDIPHTLLLHHNLLNALFLDDLLEELTISGWKLIDAKDSYKDSIYSIYPNIQPAGESLIWQSAKADSLLSKYLRYPAEDSQYEMEPLKKYLSNFNSLKK